MSQNDDEEKRVIETLEEELQGENEDFDELYECGCD